jgi:arylsulfatase
MGLYAGFAHAAQKPNIVVIWGDDIGESNISVYNFGLMGYKTPNIDRLAKDGMMFTGFYADQSCTAGGSPFITGQLTVRTGLSKGGMSGAPEGLQAGEAQSFYHGTRMDHDKNVGQILDKDSRVFLNSPL